MTKNVALRGQSEISDFSFASKNFSAEVYAEVAKRARLRDVRLGDSEYSVKHHIFAEAETSDIGLSQSYFGELFNYNFDQDEGMLAGEYAWGAEVKCGRKKALKIRCRYLLIYSGLAGANPEHVNLYFKKLARFTSYPYFRAHFANHVSGSGLNLGPLPSLTDRMD